MFHFEIIGLFALVIIAWFWLDSLKAREIGIAAVKAACMDEGLQLLDETISFERLGMVRNGSGRWVWLRVYAFEYSNDGSDRRKGSVHLQGYLVVMINVGLRLASLDGRLL